MKYVVARIGDVILRHDSTWLVIDELKNDDDCNVIVVLHGDGSIGRYRKIYAPADEVIRDATSEQP